jgi:hypothetical protein
MPSENGSAVRGASAFEAFFLAARGRAPTAEEAKRCLAFDRLAKTSEMDPATLAFIVGDSGSSSDKALEAVCERLERVEQKIDDLAKRPTASGGLAIPMDDLMAEIVRHSFVFGGGVLASEGVVALACWARWIPATLDTLTAAFGLGLSASVLVLVYIWLAPHFRDRRW